MVKALGSRLLVAFLGVLLALALVEGALRIADIAPRRELRPFWFRQVEMHETFGWFHVPNSEFLYVCSACDLKPDPGS